jgi:catalase
LFDAVAILVSPDGAAKLANESTCKDFVSDAYAHLKFIGYNDAAAPILEKAGVAKSMDEGFSQLKDANDASAFLDNCGKLRLWSRGPKVKMTM